MTHGHNLICELDLFTFISLRCRSAHISSELCLLLSKMEREWPGFRSANVYSVALSRSRKVRKVLGRVSYRRVLRWLMETDGWRKRRRRRNDDGFKIHQTGRDSVCGHAVVLSLLVAVFFSSALRRAGVSKTKCPPLQRRRGRTRGGVKLIHGRVQYTYGCTPRRVTLVAR